MRGVPRARRAISLAPSARHADAEHAGAALDDLFELFLGIEIQPHRNAEAVAQRRGEQARARGGADQRERREVDLHRARRRPLADDEVELEVLHRRIEDFLDRRIEPVDLVDEQHVALFEIGEQRGEIAGLGDHRAGGGAEIRRPARARRSAPAWSCRGPGGPTNSTWSSASLRARAASMNTREIGARLLLADEFGEPLRTQRGVRRRRRGFPAVTRRRGVVITAVQRPADTASTALPHRGEDRR